MLATGGIAGISRYMRTEVLEVIHQDYVRTAQAKGLSERAVVYVHAGRNALIPIATLLGPQITGLLGGCGDHGDDLVLAGVRADVRQCQV